MPLKRIALFTIIFLMPSFVYFIMCPFAHSLTLNGNSHLVLIQQQIQKNQLQQKEYTSSPVWHYTFDLFKLQTHDKTVTCPPSPSHREPPFSLTLLETFRLNI